MAKETESKLGLLPVFERVSDKLERNAGVVVALSLLLIFLLALGQSAGKLLWYDELVTVKTASFPHWGDIWNFYAQGLDTPGPLPSFVARIGLMLPVSPEIASRLPFTLAYLVMCLCLFAFVRLRYPAGYALAAMIYPLHHPVFFYATEVRAYALVLAGAGVAMLCWQSVASGLHRRWSLFGLWFSLAFAVNAHPYAIFLFIPFALAQFALDFRRKKRDWAAWAAIFLFAIGLLPVLRGNILAGKAFHTNFWLHPDIQSVFSSYQDFFFSYLSYFIVILLAAIGAALLLTLRRPAISEHKMSGFFLPEWVLAVMLALLPVYVVLFSYFIHHMYLSRYVVCCNIGLILLVIAALAEATRRNRIAGVALFALLLLASAHRRADTFVHGLNALVHPGSVHGQILVGYNSNAWVRLLENSALPVITDDPQIYSQLDFYAPPELMKRLYIVTDLQEMKLHPMSSNHQRNLLSYGVRLGYHAANLGDLLPQHAHFLLVENTSKVDIWLSSYLFEQQKAGDASVRCLGPDCAGPEINIYDVRLTEMPIRTE